MTDKKTILIGGGTPDHLSLREAIDRLSIREMVDVKTAIETKDKTESIKFERRLTIPEIKQSDIDMYNYQIGKPMSEAKRKKAKAQRKKKTNHKKKHR
jgi:hypothetical protein